MLRWKYLLPRVGILLVIILLLNLFTSPLARFMIVRSAQSVTGARVDIGYVDASILDGRIVISDFQIADPRHPMRNIMQGELAELNLNALQLLHRRWVIEHAKLSHVQFGTPRIESGLLEPSPNDEHPSMTDRVLGMAGDRLESARRGWAEDVKSRIPALIEENLESVRLANELRDRWPAEFQRQKDNATRLQRRAQELKNFIAEREDNPLRDLQRFQSAVLQAQQLMHDFHRAQREVHQLTTRFREDRQAMIEANERDKQRIASATADLDINADELTDLLLGENRAEMLREITGWLSWFREVVPDPEKDFHPQRARGFDVRFRQEPGLLFEEVELEGEGRIAGQSVRFRGSANNVSTTPQLVDQPATFHLQGSGQAQVAVSGTIDRRGPQKIDTVRMVCPQIAVPAKQLGDADSLLVDVTPGHMALELDAQLFGDQLSGQLKVRQTDFQMSVASASPAAGGNTLVQSMNSQLTGMNEFQMTIDLGGTLNKPEARLESDLGQQLAAMVGNSFQGALQQAARDKSRELDSILQRQLGNVDQMFSVNSREILSMLANEVDLVARLQDLATPGSLTLPSFR